MRARRHFQPMLDSMPCRIAPSAVGGLIHVAAHVAPVASHGGFSVADDTDPPDGGPSSPTIIAPVTPPTTLPC
jgi:hypothetical protein